VVKTTWLALKTLLFTTIMISTACLNTLLHTPPAKTGIHSTLALTTIRTLFHLSFVLSQFGGVTTTASSGFPELKQAFYLALDMISVDQKACEDLISSLNLEVGQCRFFTSQPHTSSFISPQAKLLGLLQPNKRGKLTYSLPLSN
jgi:hypothetical protein